jgi:hypothetical protein
MKMSVREYRRYQRRWRKENIGDILALEDILLAIGGDDISPQPEPLLPLILSHGKLLDYPVKIKRMRRNLCHENVLRLWVRGNLDALAFGYGLSDDGMWRPHWWALRDKTIVETTVPREAYFGFLANPPKEWAKVIVGNQYEEQPISR